LSQPEHGALSGGFPLAFQDGLEMSADRGMAELVPGVGQLLMGLPAVTVDDPGEGFAQQVLGLLPTAAGQPSEHLRAPGSRSPQPHPLLPTPAESRFIGVDRPRSELGGFELFLEFCRDCSSNSTIRSRSGWRGAFRHMKC
jgi:hypothetical protein